MELNVSASPPNGEATDGLKKMKKSIKKRNVCLIACAVAVVVCLALFVQFAAKPLLNQMFYAWLPTRNSIALESSFIV